MEKINNTLERLHEWDKAMQRLPALSINTYVRMIENALNLQDSKFEHTTVIIPLSIADSLEDLFRSRGYTTVQHWISETKESSVCLTVWKLKSIGAINPTRYNHLVIPALGV